MTFAVFMIGGGDFNFAGESSYQLEANGALTVIDPDKQRKIVFGPAAWQRIELAERPDERMAGGR
jgi:hypothetical protein